MIRGTGHIPDRPAERASVLSLMGFSRTPARLGLDSFVPLVDHVRDQGESNGCVPMAVTNAAHLVARKFLDRGALHASPGALYGLAQLAHPATRGTGVILPDIGCVAELAFQQGRYFGLVPESEWAYTDENCRRPPPLDVLEKGLNHELKGYYGIDEVGPARSLAARSAMAAGYPVCLGLAADEGFDEAKGLIDLPFGRVRGSHYAVLVDYDVGRFLLLNSYGTSWGDGGYQWISDARLEHETTQDLRCVTVAPKL